MLNAVEDYLPWRTQFESFLVSNGLLGMIDRSIPMPPTFTYDSQGREILNPSYYAWLKIDQTVRSWLFATLSRLVEVHDLKLSFQSFGQSHGCIMFKSKKINLYEKLR